MDALERSVAYYGADTNGNNFYNIAIVKSDLTIYAIDNPSVVRMSKDIFTDLDKSNNVGVALTRRVVVHEPSTLALLALGLLGLATRQFKKQS